MADTTQTIQGTAQAQQGGSTNTGNTAPTTQAQTPTPTLPTIESVLEKANAIMDLNKLLRESLENATKSLLNVSVATEEQIALVVEFTKEQEQDITLQGGVIIPNALKLVNGLKQKAQELAGLIEKDYNATKQKTAQELMQEFKAFIALKDTEVQSFKNNSTNEFNALLQRLEAQKQAQAQDYTAIKQEVQEKLALINTDAFLNEFAELKINMEANIQKVNRILSNHALLVAAQNANNAVILQKIFTLIKRKDNNGNTDNTDNTDTGGNNG